jgi:hypothetical protein
MVQKAVEKVILQEQLVDSRNSPTSRANFRLKFTTIGTWFKILL